MSGVAATSRDAYASAQSSGLIASHAQRVLMAMDRGERYSRRLLARRAALETSAVPGCTQRLIEQGRIQVVGKGPCPITGKTVELLELI